MKDNKCTKSYPKPFLHETQQNEDGYPSYRRRKPGQGGFETTIYISRTKQTVTIDNRWIVPYSPLLSKTFDAHINVEYCNSVKAIKYICKYVNKGSDMAMVGLRDVEKYDEVDNFQKARYISSNEAIWRILSFPIHDRYPTVVHMDVHLENGQRVYFNPNNPQRVLNQVQSPKNTKLMAFFELCSSDNFASTLLYPDVPRYYTWKETAHIWQRRTQGRHVEGWPGIREDKALGRVYTIHPNNKECFYLRMLLHTVRGPTGFSDLKTVNGKICETFREACDLHGLLRDDIHWEHTLEEASISCSAYQIRTLFAIMLTCSELSNPMHLWTKFLDHFCEDITHRLEVQLG